MSAYWGIDMGGTKIEAVVMQDLHPEAVIFRERIPTEAAKGFDHILGQIAKIVDIAKAQTGLEPDIIGIGTPGAHDPQTGNLKNSNTVALNGQPFKAELQKRLGLPLVLANDANCFALAEARMGVIPEQMPEAEVVFGIIMGTGVGGGIVINGRVLNGRQGIAGEWGHSFLEESGGTCYCGNIGCVETLISGTGLQRYYASVSGEQRKLKDIVAMRDTDPWAGATMDRLIHFFGKGVANLIDILDPDAIVVGGGVGNIDALYHEGVESIKKHVFNLRLDTRILKPRLGDSAGVFGAAVLAANAKIS
jgi:fructokinase